ncbi:hypothetical protein AVEN_149841-1 [Araneus ventricosus]|uniref:Uncharacterized protein n=1 Tax=Araneus ventricosus TaxID=182803 RepID=A0A4Y2DYW4_ARAVE|nr:hypothetical protein AVEN_149841-1 [Araneus ventricosus]
MVSLGSCLLCLFDSPALHTIGIHIDALMFGFSSKHLVRLWIPSEHKLFYCWRIQFFSVSCTSFSQMNRWPFGHFLRGRRCESHMERHRDCAKEA